MDKSFEALDFERCPLEHVVYKRSEEKEKFIVGVYVNDLIITGESIKDINKFKFQMNKLLCMSDLGLFSYYLEIEVGQSLKRITLTQFTNTTKVFNKYMCES